MLYEIIRLAGMIDGNLKAVISPEILAKIPSNMRVYKPAAASLIVREGFQKKVKNVSKIETLLGQNANKPEWLEVLGGALSPIEEKAMDAMFMGAEFPNIPNQGKGIVTYGGAFYHLQVLSLLSTGSMRQLDYCTKNGETDLNAALREAVEEGLVGDLTIVHQFANRIDIAVPFKPSNNNLEKALIFGSKSGSGLHKIIYGDEPIAAQIVQQTGFLATVPKKKVEFKENKEIVALHWVTFETMLELAKAKLGLPCKLPKELEGKMLRNSIPLHFLKWLIEYLIVNFEGAQW